MKTFNFFTAFASDLTRGGAKRFKSLTKTPKYLKMLLLTAVMLVGSANVWGQKTYELVTDANQLVHGKKYLITGEVVGTHTWHTCSNADFSNALYSVSLGINATVPPASWTLDPATIQEVELRSGASGTWGIYLTHEEKFLTCGTLAGNGAGMATSIIVSTSDGASGFYISFNGNAAVVRSNTNTTGSSNRTTLRFNPGSPSFRFYDGTTQNSIYLYVEQVSCTPPPTLTSDPSAIAGNEVEITYDADTDWEDAIDSIKIDGTKYVDADDVYLIEDGSFIIDGSYLTVAGNHQIIVYATGYCPTATLTQTITAGALHHLSMVRQPAAPAINGNVLATQPYVAACDQYENYISGIDITATANAATWTLGGSVEKTTQPSVSPNAGEAWWTNLTAGTSGVAVPDAYIHFEVADNSAIFVNSAPFAIPAIAPAITVSETSLSGFTYQEEDGPTGAQTFTVSGQYLTGNVTISAPENYEISLSSGSDYEDVIELTATSGTIAATTIYVRLKANLTAGNYNSQNIIVSSLSSDFVDKNVACSGTVTPIPAGAKTYELVTDECMLVAGKKYLIVALKGTSTTAASPLSGTNPIGIYALGRQIYSAGTGNPPTNRVAICIQNTGTAPTEPPATIDVAPASAATDLLPFEITLNGTTDNWVLYDAVNSANLGPAPNATASNYLIPRTEPTFTIEVNEDTYKASITCVGTESNTAGTGRNNIFFNRGSNSPSNALFACYQTSSIAADIYNGYLYREVPTCPSLAITKVSDFTNVVQDKLSTAVINVKGANLEGDVTVGGYDEEISITGATTITQEHAENEDGYNLTISLIPADKGTGSATITFSYDNSCNCAGGGVSGLQMLFEWEADETTGIITPQIIRAIYAVNQEIIFTAAAGETVNIYNAVCQSLVSVVAKEGENRITLPYTGVALVRIGENVAKVVLR
ncbi:MAG: DUF1533 domain-containing protein [Prevotellaceae bacterium]|jgi:hypothetical protein|nr:DUF1533 domain-containing protein [Prevotellaceae bacterium]